MDIQTLLIIGANGPPHHANAVRSMA